VPSALLETFQNFFLPVAEHGVLPLDHLASTVSKVDAREMGANLSRMLARSLVVVVALLKWQKKNKEDLIQVGQTGDELK
jgi:hypothetical protein